MALNPYEIAKGKSAKTDLGQPSAITSAASKPLTEDEIALCIHHRDFVDAYLPEARELIQGLVACGLITGWRNVTKTELEEHDGFSAEDR